MIWNRSLTPKGFRPALDFGSWSRTRWPEFGQTAVSWLSRQPVSPAGLRSYPLMMSGIILYLMINGLILLTNGLKTTLIFFKNALYKYNS